MLLNLEREYMASSVQSRKAIPHTSYCFVLLAAALLALMLGLGAPAPAVASPVVVKQSFTLSPSVGAFTLLVGGSSGITVINVNDQNGFSGSVSMAVSGVPGGVTAVLASPNTPYKSALTLTPTSAAVPGTYTVLVTGTSGTLTSSTTVAVTIPKPSFTLASSASALTALVGGSSVSSSISVLNAVGLSSNAVNVSASGVPAGVAARFNWPVAAVGAPVTLTLTPSASALPGTYSVKISGTSGTASSAATIALTIPQPSFSLTASASSLTLLLGQNGWNLPVNISAVNLVGLAGNVGFSVSGLPANVTSAFTTINVTSQALTFKVGTTATPGTYPIKVTGTSGTTTSSVTFSLIIPAASFTLSSSASALTLQVGGANAASTISVTGQSGFSGSVSLSVSGLPSGVTSVFSSPSTSSASTLTFTPGSAAVPGSYKVVVTGTSGTLTASTGIALTIPTPNFTLSSSSSALTLTAGGAGATSTIGIVNPAGSTSGTVTLAVSGVPAGVTATLSSASATAASPSVLTLKAAATAAAGSYPVTVAGTSAGLTSATTIALTISAPVSAGPVSIAITQPTFGFNVLPGSVRRIFATVTNGVSNAVNWTVTGGARLSSSSGNWVDVTAPATGSHCSINGTSNSTVSSATQFTLTAQSQESSKPAASITINVCNPAVQVSVVPFYTTLYAGQKADIQAFVWGSTNLNVNWSISAAPNGGDGVLTDAANQDTVFSATVAGRYTIKATSAADGSTMNTATVYVTGHQMTYNVTPSETMPVDCSVDPALTGTTYDVGPSQPFKTIQSVPWTSLAAGSTVRIHNEDTAGGNPTTYHEYFQLTTHAARTQPVRVCGVPDSRGNLPVIDASQATGRSDASTYSPGYTPVGIGATGWAGVYSGTWTGPQYLIVEGLKIQNAKPAFTYTTPAGVANTAWVQGAACVRLFRSMDTVVRGIDAYNCSNGFFSDFNANNGFAAIANTQYEGNHLHGNGDVGAYSEHQLYIQGWNEVVQFNVIDQYQSGAQGSNFKGRGYPEILRYNHFGDGAARQLDLVDNTDAGAYTTFEGYLGGTSSYHAIYPADAYTADLLAAAVEAHHADYVYGNTFVNSSAGVPIHYATDHGSLENDRIGTLWFYNNSFYEPTCNGCSNWRWEMFDTSGGGGNDYPEIEWPQIQAHNNAIWMDAPTKPYFYWENRSTEFTTFGKNVINSNWGTNNMAGGDGTGWTTGLPTNAFQGASNSADTTGINNLIGVAADPFDVSTFAPNPVLVNAGASLPAAGPKLPVRFQYGPSAVQTVRVQPLTVGAME